MAEDMTKMDFQSVMHALMEGASGSITAKTVVGDPIRVGSTTIIPLSDVTMGCAAGSGVRDHKNTGSGGFAAKLSPSAVLVIRDGMVKVINIKNQDAVSKLVDIVPDVVDKVAAFRNRGEDEVTRDEAVAKAFPDKK